MDPGWLVLFLFMMCEVIVVTLLTIPMPNNQVRGVITNFVMGLWEKQPVRYTVYAMLALDLFYFYFVCGALLHPLYDFGILSPIEGGLTCEAKQDIFFNERNAYLTGMSIFLFLCIQRLVDIQDKLHVARNRVKELEGGSKKAN